MRLSHKRKIAHKKGTYQPRLVCRCLGLARLKPGEILHLKPGEKLEFISRSALERKEKLAAKLLEVKRRPYRRFGDSVRRLGRAIAGAFGFSSGVTGHNKTLNQT